MIVLKHILGPLAVTNQCWWCDEHLVPLVVQHRQEVREWYEEDDGAVHWQINRSPNAIHSKY